VGYVVKVVYVVTSFRNIETIIQPTTERNKHLRQKIQIRANGRAYPVIVCDYCGAGYGSDNGDSSLLLLGSAILISGRALHKDRALPY
jgi:hypothetical protein